MSLSLLRFISLVTASLCCSVNLMAFIINATLLERTDPESGRKHTVVLLGEIHLKNYERNKADTSHISSLLQALRAQGIRREILLEVSPIEKSESSLDRSKRLVAYRAGVLNVMVMLKSDILDSGITKQLAPFSWINTEGLKFTATKQVLDPIHDLRDFLYQVYPSVLAEIVQSSPLMKSMLPMAQSIVSTRASVNDLISHYMSKASSTCFTLGDFLDFIAAKKQAYEEAVERIQACHPSVLKTLTRSLVPRIAHLNHMSSSLVTFLGTRQRDTLVFPALVKKVGAVLAKKACDSSNMLSVAGLFQDISALQGVYVNFNRSMMELPENELNVLSEFSSPSTSGVSMVICGDAHNLSIREHLKAMNYRVLASHGFFDSNHDSSKSELQVHHDRLQLARTLRRFVAIICTQDGRSRCEPSGGRSHMGTATKASVSAATSSATSCGAQKVKAQQKKCCALASCSLEETGEKTLSRCSRCKGVYYCCREHQRRDWRRHKLSCQEPSES